MTRKPLEPLGRYYGFEVSPEERKLEKVLLRRMLFEILVIREFETRLLELKDRGLIHGPVHSSIGQEGAAVGAVLSLDKEDIVGSTHRGHHHFLAKAFGAVLGEYEPAKKIPEGLGDILKRTLEEILGLASGYCRGRGGSMHLGEKTYGCLGTNAIVAGGVPIVTGAAWAHKIDGNGRIGVAFLGDGAVNQGAVHEVMNMAVLWKLPVVYFIENNLYAVATHVKESCSLENLAQRGLGYGMESFVVDGMDPIAVYLAMVQAKKTALSGIPVLIEAKTYRYKHQAQSLPGSAFGYRSKAEEDQWHTMDPVLRLPEELLNSGVLSDSEFAGFKDEALRLSLEAVSSVVRKDGDSYFIPPELYPRREELEIGVRSEGREFSGASYAEPKDFPDQENKVFIDVISEVMGRRLDTDPSSLIIGEEVGRMKGGAFMATKGIFKKHPARVVDTPISENGFTGMALGLALFGKKPIVEIMYPDFALVAADQLFNQIGKCRYMYGNQFEIPLIVRSRVSIGTGYGAQHSMDPASLYALFEGWRIVAPSSPFDYIGLFNTAYRSLDPVLVIEHQALYTVEGPVPKDRDFLIPFGKARLCREGRHVTIVSYSLMTRKSSAAAEALAREGIEAEVVDLRTIDYSGIDYETIGVSVKKTGKLLLVEEGHSPGGIGSEIAYQVYRRFFDYLDGEIERVAGVSVPMPVSKVLENMAVPQVSDIIDAVKRMLM